MTREKKETTDRLSRDTDPESALIIMMIMHHMIKTSA